MSGNNYSRSLPFETNSKDSIRKYKKYAVLYGERKYAQTKQNLSFMDLPPEIRIMISENLLVAHKPFELAASNQKVFGRSWREFRRMRKMLKLLRLNKTIRNEAAEIFYGKNEFRFSSSSGWVMLSSFLATIGDFNTKFLRKVTVNLGFARDPYWSTNSKQNYESMVLRRRNMKVPRYFDSGTRRGISRNAYRQACRKLAQAGTLKPLQLAIPCYSHMASPYDEAQQLVCTTPNCTRTDGTHVRERHGDRWYWKELEELRAKLEDLEIMVVLQHDSYATVTRVAYEACLRSQEWLVLKAREMGFRVAHSSDYLGRYRVIDDDDIMEGYLPGWQLPA